jgi:hypothetical protein
MDLCSVCLRAQPIEWHENTSDDDDMYVEVCASCHVAKHRDRTLPWVAARAIATDCNRATRAHLRRYPKGVYSDDEIAPE